MQQFRAAGGITESLRRISAFVNKWKKDRRVRLGTTLAAVILSALVQAYALQVFARSAGIISGGFTGTAMLIERLGNPWGLTTPMQVIMFLMNIPVTFMYCKGVGVRFTVFSLMQVFLNSIFLQIFSFTPIFTDEVLNVIFSGVIFGSATVIALRGNVFSGGTDFIALSVSNRTGQPIWSYVFFDNAIMHCLYGSISGWKYAGYPTISQFISTRMIPALHRRHELATLQVTTVRGPEVVEAYISRFRRGMSCAEVTGGYSKKKMYLFNTFILAYEVNDAVHVMQEADEHVIINVLKTQQFAGWFYRAPLE